MSTWAYAELTTKREEGEPGTTEQVSPGVKSYVDALAALVPAEVLTVHALIVSYTTETRQDATDTSITAITEPGTLFVSFFVLIVLSIVLYVVPRWGKLDKLDYARAAIPAAAFVAWTMLQKATAFDAVAPGLREAPRNVIALLMAIVVGVLAVRLAYSADAKQSEPAV